MSILSFSLQGDTTERITAWERESATYERDSGNFLNEEIKIGTLLIRFPESRLKTHLLMSVDTPKKWTDFTGEVVAISRAISTAQTQPTPMDVGATSKGTPSKGGKGAQRERHTRQSWHSKHVQDAEARDHTSANCPSLRQDEPKVRKSRSPGERVSTFWNSAAHGKGRQELQAQSKRALMTDSCWTHLQ